MVVQSISHVLLTQRNQLDFIPCLNCEMLIHPNSSRSGFCNGLSCKSGLGKQTNVIVTTQLCYSPSPSVGRRVSGFRTLHLFMVMLGISNRIACYR